MRGDFPVVNRPRGKSVAPRPMQEIACSRCPNTDAISAASGRLPAHTVALKFGQRGWRVIGIGKHVCPACVAVEAARKKAPPVQDESIAMAQKPAPNAPAPKTPAPLPAPANENAGHATPAASDAIVNLSLFLSDYYDKARKAYVEGWDDERMARETGLSPVHVAEFREKYFGPLVKDTTLEDIAAATLALAQEIAGLEGEIDALQRAAATAITTCGRLKVSLNALRKVQARLSAPPVVKAA